jgi:arylsulfatase A-like enzyme
LDALKSLGLAADTIVLVTSDHGSHFKTRNAEYKRSCHEAAVRIPTAFQGPGFDGGGQVCQLVSLVDLPPTLLDAAGLPVPQEMDGRSILPLLRLPLLRLPLLRGPSVEWPEEAFIQISESQVGRAIRTARWKYGVIAPDLDGWQVSGANRYVEDVLYDLQADPYELTNLAGVETFRGVADDLAGRLIRRMVQAGEDAPCIEPAPPRPSGQRSPALPPYPLAGTASSSHGQRTH